MAEEVASSIICGNPDCRVAETGKCVEGMETAKCPYFGRSSTGDQPEDSSSRGIALPFGFTLSSAEASELLRAREGRVIAIVGPSDAGKTSMIASLYDLFQEGPVGEIAFAGSRSLGEFEHVCHDARAASRRGIPHINRTPLGEVRFYHLDVANAAGPDVLAIYLADRAGEEYRTQINDISAVDSFPEIGRADSITLLIDGERLLDTGGRHNVRSEALLIVRAMLEAGAIWRLPRLAVVLTKFDLVVASGQRERAEADFDRLFGAVKELGRDHFSAVGSFKIAASPKSDSLRRGTGVRELLGFWFQPPPQPVTVLPDLPPSERLFGRLRALEEAEEHE